MLKSADFCRSTGKDIRKTFIVVRFSIERDIRKTCVDIEGRSFVVSFVL